MPNLLPPRPGGTLAAIAACPQADVIFVAHAGLDNIISVGDVWRNFPIDQVIRAKWWRVPVDQVPRSAGHEAQVQWLYDWWERIDSWISAEPPARRTGPGGRSRRPGPRSRHAPGAGRGHRPSGRYGDTVIGHIATGPEAWRGLAAGQQPDWPDPGRLTAVTRELAALPPLVLADECDLLRARLAAVTRGEAFVLQGGDCAETFEGATADAVRAKLQTLLQMALVLTYGASVPVVKIARMAGQFAKPRSQPTEDTRGCRAARLPRRRGERL